MNWEWTSKSNHFTWSFRSLRIEITILNCSFLVRTSKVIEVQAHILACGSVNAKLKSQSHSIEKWVTHIGAKRLFEVAFHFSKIYLPVLHGCSKWLSILDVSKLNGFFVTTLHHFSSFLHLPYFLNYYPRLNNVPPWSFPIS